MKVTVLPSVHVSPGAVVTIGGLEVVGDSWRLFIAAMGAMVIGMGFGDAMTAGIRRGSSASIAVDGRRVINREAWELITKY